MSEPELERGPQSFACKRSGCDKSVEYVPLAVPGALKRTSRPAARRRVVYLRCADGHVHPYEVGPRD